MTVVSVIFSCNTNGTANEHLKSCFTNEQYLSVEQTLASNSDHVNFIQQTIEEKVLPYLKEKGSFLDVGAGPGEITQRISKNFRSITVVEPNLEFHKLYSAIGLTSSIIEAEEVEGPGETGKLDVKVDDLKPIPLYSTKGYQLYPYKFEDCVISQNYDFVLCSHMLYHVDVTEWPRFISRVLARGKPGGICMINMAAPRGSFHELCSSLKPSYGNSSQVISCLESLGLKFEVIKVANQMRTDSFQKLQDLLRLYAIDDCFTQDEYEAFPLIRKNEISKTIEKFVQKQGSPQEGYQLNSDDDYILIYL